jgi:hypothetical protein
VLALAAANAVGVLLFGTLYAVAGARLMPQPAFLGCLFTLFVLVTAFWVHTESRHRMLEPLRRIGRIALSLVAVVIVTPAFVLMPLFWLDSYVPAEAGLNPMLGPVMAIVLIALVLTVIVNVVGAIVATAMTLARRRPPSTG